MTEPENVNLLIPQSRSTAGFDGTGNMPKITRWFDCQKDGRPTIVGWYEWELFLIDDRGQYNIVRTMALYAPGIDFVLVNGRAIGVTDEDQWRGLEPPNVK